MKAKVAVLISGAGTNMAALLYAAKLPNCPYEIVLVASNNSDAEGLKIASTEGVPVFAKSHVGLERAAHDAIMHEAITQSGATYVVLAGYMRILSTEFVAKWDGRMLNIHPSLLPKYKGLHTHQRAIQAKDPVAGTSVHLVTAELDDGPVLGQIEVAILLGDTADTLADRVKMAEYQLYPKTLADYVARDTNPEFLIAQVRAIALAQPESNEVQSQGMPCFGIIGGKKFAYVSVDHRGDGKIALLVKISGVEEQTMLIDSDADCYYRPAYFGDGWVGIRLDLGDTDWDHINDWVAKSWRAVAPKKLSKLMDVVYDF
ncbi:phosphoribosylglycinamide formyltransferase [Sphingorhabdus sp.]|jgi:phosphoribosylglycinamide formyltransferase-1|uniref:phosphoribosylglycinamide formyltransferase n=1 Tax=Sphingorhabdus sp. TaxID=1902408 RepID=UPI0037C5FA3F